MRDAAARGALRGRGAVPQPAVRDRGLAERQGADRRAVGTIDVIGFAVEGDRAAVQLFPLRDGKLIDRHAFHLENVDGQDRRRSSRRSASSTTRLRRACRRS